MTSSGRTREGPSRRGPVITVDGPAASGKSSTAREVARRLGIRHLDSGALYRALTYALLDEGVPQEEWVELEADDLESLQVQVEPTEEGIRIRHRDRPLDSELRTARVTARVSSLASVSAVRSWLLRRQREAARHGALVAEGRDMGSVVFPDADLKIFLVADLEERARRRLRERGEEEGPDAVRDEALRLARRDRDDETRSVAPLRKAEDAVEVDTTGLTLDEQVDRIVAMARGLTGSDAQI